LKLVADDSVATLRTTWFDRDDGLVPGRKLVLRLLRDTYEVSRTTLAAGKDWKLSARSIAKHLDDTSHAYDFAAVACEEGTSNCVQAELQLRHDVYRRGMVWNHNYETTESDIHEVDTLPNPQLSQRLMQPVNAMPTQIENFHCLNLVLKYDSLISKRRYLTSNRPDGSKT